MYRTVRIGRILNVKGFSVSANRSFFIYLFCFQNLLLNGGKNKQVVQFDDRRVDNWRKILQLV